jgi:hypothetical protein
LRQFFSVFPADFDIADWRKISFMKIVETEICPSGSAIKIDGDIDKSETDDSRPDCVHIHI